LEHLLSVWHSILYQLKNAKNIILLTDYDGTLTPITTKPELASLPAGTKLLLKSLASQHNIRVGVISGRALADIKRMVDIKGIIYAGNHGLEIEGPGINFINPLAQEMVPILHVIQYLLKQTVGKVKGILLEDKGLTIAVHYRLAEDIEEHEVKSTLDHVVGGAQIMGKVKITNGKKVYEIRPEIEWDKGKAIRLLMKKYGKGGRNSGLMPIYLGDDLTDEDGFKFIEKYGKGISIFVGESNQNTSARYYLKSPFEVEVFLGLLSDSVGRGFR
jgi:trehalose 6-phosphate phosphatase